LEPELSAIKMEVWNKVFPPFKEKVLVAAAEIHFFHEMDDDFERLKFLMDQCEKGNDPDALLELIGASRSYWDPFLRSSGTRAGLPPSWPWKGICCVCRAQGRTWRRKA
jgi:hypothetical protein